MSTLSFDGWQTALKPENLTLLPLLSFRRTKDDFTYDSCKEHFAISKFLENLNFDTTDQQWVIAAESISVKQQVRSEEVKKFWLDIDLEKAESERKLAGIILEQKEIELKQKEVDIKLSKNILRQGIKDSLLNDQKLKYAENLVNDKETELKPYLKKSTKRKPVCSNGNLTETEDNEYFPDDNDLDPESFNSTLDRNNKKAVASINARSNDIIN
ncbi:24457_t:CDS:2 [Cetraspora pellucida]|uniref:24457_t:CDS:1 n=1 Tax=Cetraspora pellucida TaxID=1433469 RepID=A0A9N9BQL4_9GLOM|nr:24457_t:CDS:2 [Cetraspora pellucida]